MPFSHDKINKLEGGWYIVYRDNTVLTEKDMPWTKIPNKKNIKIMGLKWRHKQLELKGKDNYIPPGETHFEEVNSSFGEKILRTRHSIIGRFIGYYEKDHKVIVRLNLSNGIFYKEKVPY